MKKYKNKIKISSILYYIFVFIILITLGGGVYYCSTNWAYIDNYFNNLINPVIEEPITEEPIVIIDPILDDTADKCASFSVRYNDVIVNDTANNLLFVTNHPFRFDVDYYCSAYSVKIVPNAVNDFTFTVDTFSMLFSAEGDFISLFSLEKFETYFTIKPVGGVDGILCNLYPTSEVIVPELDSSLDYFTMIVTASNGKQIKINFGLLASVTGVASDTATLVFGV